MSSEPTVRSSVSNNEVIELLLGAGLDRAEVLSLMAPTGAELPTAVSRGSKVQLGTNTH